MTSRASLAIALLFSVLPLEAGDITDGLFDEAEDQIVADNGPQVDLSAVLITAQPKVSGSITTSGAVWAGWNDGPSGGAGYDLSAGLTFDYRPDPTLHWAATLGTSIPVGSYTWSTPAVDTMYLDYTLANTVFLSLGKFGMGWGVGRLFNVNDLLADVDKGLTVKAFVPVGPLGVTGAMMARSGFFANPAVPSYNEFGLAGMIETSIGPLNLGVSGYRQRSQAPKLDGYIKTVVAGFDVFSEVRFQRSGTGEWVPLAMAGLYWEGLSPKIAVQAEWMGQREDHSMALAASWAVIPGTPVKPSVKWTHALVDGSGQVVAGFEGDPAPHLHLTLGVPVSYGATGSRWVQKTVSSYYQPWGLALKLDISAAF